MNSWNLSSSIPIVHTPHDHPPTSEGTSGQPSSNRKDDKSKHEERTGSDDLSPIWHCVVSGGIGGIIGDSAMHSLDTVKTRQQGAPNVKKYRNMISAYRTIWLEEGVRRGLYGGYMAAMLGSFPSAAIFFGTYEYTKRTMIEDWQINDTITHLSAGFLGDFISSFVYVPSEVLKTRLQLQGRFNNPFFQSGYNYSNLRNAIKTVIKEEGFRSLFFGYKATLARDLPFSALQFAFYEKFRQLAFKIEQKDGKDRELSIPNEILTGACAGGLAGIITTPMDVVKTRVQTQQPPSQSNKSYSVSHPHVTNGRPAALSNSISLSLRTVYQSEGALGFFSGVGPRFVWTSVQSSIMLLLYQMTLRGLGNAFPTD